MLTLFELIYHFVFFLISLFLVYSIGKIISSFYQIEREFKMKLFLSMLIGVLTISLVFSLIKTHGITIQIALVPLVIYVIYYYRKSFVRFSIDIQEVKKEVLILFVCGSIIYFYQSSFYFDYFNLTVKQLFVDNYTYAQTSHSMQFYGSENFNFGANDFFAEIRNERTPYRYGDLWVSAFFTYITKLSSVFCFYCITISLLISTLMIGIFELLKPIGVSILGRYILSFILLFVSIFFIPYLNSIHDLKYVSEPSLMGSFQQKLALTSLISFLAIYLWNKNRTISIVLWISLPVFYVSYLPSIWGGVLLLSIFYMFKNKFSLVNSRKYIFLFFLVLTFIVFFFTFYHFFGNTFSKLNNPNLSDAPILKRLPNELINNTSDSISLKKVIVEFFVYTIPNTFIYLKGSIGHLIIGTLFFIPYLFFVSVKRTNRSLILFYFFILFSGLFGLVMNDGMGDNYQFYTNNLIFISLALILGIIFKINTIEKPFKSPIILLLLFFIISFNLFPIIAFKSEIGKAKKDISFLSKIKEEVKGDSSIQILFLINENEFESRFYNWVGRNDLFCLQQLMSQRVEFNIGNPEKYLKNNTLLKFDSTFYYYWSALNYWRLKTGEVNLDKFIDRFNIKYLYLDSKVAIPNVLQSRIRNVIKNKSGKRFITLSNSSLVNRLGFDNRRN
jgi:hypothetical protein